MHHIHALVWVTCILLPTEYCILRRSIYADEEGVVISIAKGAGGKELEQRAQAV